MEWQWTLASANLVYFDALLHQATNMYFMFSCMHSEEENRVEQNTPLAGQPPFQMNAHK